MIKQSQEVMTHCSINFGSFGACYYFLHIAFSLKVPSSGDSVMTMYTVF
jgi:hypothetical protein